MSAESRPDASSPKVPRDADNDYTSAMAQRSACNSCSG